MQLLDAAETIGDWLLRERGLALNPKHGQIRPDREPGVFLGYRIARAGVAPSRKLRRRFKQRVRAAAREGDAALERCLISYRGLLVFP
jgi:hypothetical protein